MLKNYFKVAVRALWKYRGFSFINLAGLAIGMSTCILITLYVMDEFSYDRFHQNAGQIYRLTPTLHTPKVDRPRAVTSPVMGPTLQANFPEIVKFVRVSGSSRILSYKETRGYDTRIQYADSTFFDVFTFPMIQGNPRTALVNPYSIVLTERAAKKYFGDVDAMGKMMSLSDTMALSVTGIIKNIPSNSHLQFDVLLSRSTITDFSNNQPEDNWFDNNLYTYFLLPKGYDHRELEAKFPAFLEKQMADIRKETGLWYDFYLQPVTDIHLHSGLSAEMAPGGNIKYVYLFAMVSIMVLLVACANYVNLSTAKSMMRAKEIGMRKVIGARRPQLITQLFGESFLITSLAFILATAIITSLLPGFNSLTGKNVDLTYLLRVEILAIFVGVFLFVGLLAGVYPAIKLSAFQPVKTLKSAIYAGRENSLLRKGLVVFQFSVSIILIIGTLLIFRQMDFLQKQNLGLEKEQMVHLRLRNSVIPKADLIKEELLKTPGVLAATASSFAYENDIASISVLPEGVQPNQMTSERVISADADFLTTFKIELVAGRDFSKDRATDITSAFMVNETAVRYFGWGTPEQSLGKNLDWGLGKEGKVIGVTKDFNFFSLHEKVQPLIIHILPDWFNGICVKIEAGDPTQTIARLEETWKSLSLDSPFDYSFLDKDFENLYRAESQTKTIIGLLSSLAIFIACLGLFGLAAFTAERRTKEIGVRKVLGADITSIVSLLSKDFLAPVLIAILLAAPIAWYAASQWLEGFAYKTEISWWIFVVAGLSSVCIALLTVSFQSIRAALSNPVDSLRSE